MCTGQRALPSGSVAPLGRGLLPCRAGDQPCAHQRRLAAARGAHHGQQAVVAQEVHQLGGQRLAAKEVIGVGQVEVLQALVGLAGGRAELRQAEELDFAGADVAGVLLDVFCCRRRGPAPALFLQPACSLSLVSPSRAWPRSFWSVDEPRQLAVLVIEFLLALGDVVDGGHGRLSRSAL